MKKILVLSDLHIPSRMDKFPYENIINRINNIDLVFGLGDFVEQQALDELNSFGKEVIAVCGNMDHPGLSLKLPKKTIINIENINIGLIHGWGSPFQIRERISKEFDNVDLICYGHTHTSFFSNEKGTGFFNPGSLSGNTQSFGILTIDGRAIDAEIIHI